MRAIDLQRWPYETPVFTPKRQASHGRRARPTQPRHPRLWTPCWRKLRRPRHRRWTSAVVPWVQDNQYWSPSGLLMAADWIEIPIPDLPAGGSTVHGNQSQAADARPSYLHARLQWQLAHPSACPPGVGALHARPRPSSDPTRGPHRPHRPLRTAVGVE
jgi:hypothetical protein